MRKEVAAACGPALDLKVDVPSFVTHKLPYGMSPIGEQEVIRTYTSLVPYIVELCQIRADV